MQYSNYKSSRTKSRSPAPPPSFQHSSPAFLPPSHYAAAAGLNYPYDHSPSLESHGVHANALASTSALTSPVSAPQKPFKPAHQAPHSSRSEAASVDSSARPEANHAGFGRPQHSLGSLPTLEAVLVPSLRDTIDRMTKQSKAPNGKSSSPRPPLLDMTYSHNRTTEPSSTIEHSHQYDLESTLSPNTYLDPKSTWNTRSNPSAPAENQSSQPKLKSVLKSALRPPTPKLSSHYAAIQNTPVPTRQVSRSSKAPDKKLRSASKPPSTMVEDIKRGAGIASYGRFASKKVTIEDPLPNEHVRSHTDPVASSRIRETHSKPTHTPQLPSNHPSRLSKRQGNALQKGHDQDSSDYQRHFNMGSRSKFKLVVANPPESLSTVSDTGQEPRTSPMGANVNSLKQISSAKRLSDTHQVAQNRFGLGIGFGDYTAKTRGMFTDTSNRIVQHEDDDRSVYDEDIGGSRDEGLAGLSSTDSLAWENHLTVNDRGLNLEKSHHRPADDIEESPGVHRRRREALLNVVQNLDFGSKPEERWSSGSSDMQAAECHEDEFYSHDVHADDRHQEQEEKRNSLGRNQQKSRSSAFPDQTRVDYDRHGGYRSNPSTDFRQQLMPHGNYSYSHPTQKDPVSGHRDEVRQMTALDENSARSRREPLKLPSDKQAFVRESNPEPPEYGIKRHSYTKSDRYSPRDFDPSSKHPRNQSPNENRESSDISRAVQNSDAAATRQREAFGIPRPISDYYTDSIHEVPSEQHLPHATSNLSSVGDDVWQEDYDALSEEAETLFRRLEVQSKDQTAKRSNKRTGQSYVTPNDHEQREHRSRSRKSPEHANHFPDPEQNRSRFGARQSWRSSLPSSVYRTLLDRYGETEIRRQEILWELYETEQTFADRLHSIVRLFVQPLRAHNRKSWIVGVPDDVARLFDWLEDIVNLHLEILAALQRARKGHYSMIDRVANSLKVLVPKLEVYQPYLARLEETTASIQRLIDDGENDFGEFVSIQEASTECDGGSLEQLLIEPVNRLGQYPDYFRRLLQVTPNTHPDHLSTFSLLHSTNMIIRVMSEVKLREDEYHSVKDIASRINNFPLSARLAKRERRLLSQGLLDLDLPVSSARVLAQVFVFTDLVIFAQPISRKRSKKAQEWQLLDRIGIVRILAVARDNTRRKTGSHGAYDLQIVPVSDSEIETGMVHEDSAVVSVGFSIPNDTPFVSTSQEHPDGENAHWLSTFQRCSKFTQRILSFTSRSGGHHGGNVDLELDTHQSVLSIMGSGLPLPKSPSVQLEDIANGEPGSSRQQEREERGWWSLRFHQVLRELQRQDALTTLG